MQRGLRESEVRMQQISKRKTKTTKTLLKQLSNICSNSRTHINKGLVAMGCRVVKSLQCNRLEISLGLRIIQRLVAVFRINW